MPLFDLYAGMAGGFGGASYCGTYEYDTIDEAVNDAYQMAIDEYQSYEGSYGVLSWEDCREDLIESFPEDDITDDDVDQHYREAQEGWIEWWAEPHNGDTN